MTVSVVCQSGEALHIEVPLTPDATFEWLNSELCGLQHIPVKSHSTFAVAIVVHNALFAKHTAASQVWQSVSAIRVKYGQQYALFHEKRYFVKADFAFSKVSAHYLRMVYVAAFIDTRGGAVYQISRHTGVKLAALQALMDGGQDEDEVVRDAVHIAVPSYLRNDTADAWIAAIRAEMAALTLLRVRSLPELHRKYVATLCAEEPLACLSLFGAQCDSEAMVLGINRNGIVVLDDAMCIRHSCALHNSEVDSVGRLLLSLEHCSLTIYLSEPTHFRAVFYGWTTDAAIDEHLFVQDSQLVTRRS